MTSPLIQPAPLSRLEPILLLQDAHYAVFNKPANQLSVPGKPPNHQHSTWQAIQNNGFPKALVVHRLDCATSGLMLFALTTLAQAKLHAQFRQRLVKKTYVALVEPAELACDAHQGSIDLPLNKDWQQRPKQRLDILTGKPSLTHWQRLAVVQTQQQNPLTPYERMQLSPVTGRSHQLRMHMLLRGQPILGDRLYHPQPQHSTDSRGLAPRLYLHAQSLQFYHPITGQVVQITCPAPF